ncbi:MAG: exodeoxyribonuclease VII small subunit [Rickettsiales bacterium]|nr:exodeoxyribonuclease VII small subunit [Rickettsiales bacterium]|tara:strand:+ start:1157 stop:1384 length:228 start_codon:yes stop_codon:yes gene_type:complete
MDLLSKDFKNLTFEEAFERLNKVVELIEGGNVSLDESIKYYEIGVLLKNHCEEKLKNAEIKIKKVVDNKIQNIDE